VDPPPNSFVSCNCLSLRRFGMDSSVKAALATRVASGDRRIWNLRKVGPFIFYYLDRLCPSQVQVGRIYLLVSSIAQIIAGGQGLIKGSKARTLVH